MLGSGSVPRRSLLGGLMQRRSGRQPVNARVLGVGAAGLAAALAVVPVAAAQSTPSGDGPAKSSHPDAGATTVRPRASTSTSVAPGFGLQKFRVGVQIKSGAWVPAGTTTAGSQVHIVETDSGGTTVNDTTCTTLAETIDPGSTESYCRFDDIPSSVRRATKRHADDFTGDPADYYYPAPGDTVTLTQSTVEPNLVIDPVTQTKEPVERSTCADLCETTPVTFNDAGPPPAATDDTATTQTPNAVDIDVLANDDPPDGAPTTLSVIDGPAHGSAQPTNQEPGTGRRRANAAGDPQIRYTPEAGYVGDDSFVYQLSTPNGTATATVRVGVGAPPPAAHDDTASTTSGHSVTIHVLANDDAKGGGKLHLDSVGDPGNGTSDTDGPYAVYTAADDFVGTDTFTYVASTAFGSSTATVTVTVDAPSTVPPSTPAPVSSAAAGTGSAGEAGGGAGSTPVPTTTHEPLATTGVPAAQITEIAVGLIVLGAAATVAGRRRRRGGHAS